MSELKIKFNVFEKRLVMQVIEQSAKLIGTRKNPIEYIASNGIIVTSSLRPGIYPNMNTIALRGEDNHEDLLICHGRFESTNSAIEFMTKANVALTEFIDKVRNNKIESLANDISSQIDLPECSLLFSIIRGGFIIQVIKSNIKQAKLVSDGDLKITVNSKDDVDITLPFNTNEFTQELVTMKNSSESDIRATIKTIIKKLYLNSFYEPVRFKNSESTEYPEFIYEVK